MAGHFPCRSWELCLSSRIYSLSPKYQNQWKQERDNTDVWFLLKNLLTSYAEMMSLFGSACVMLMEGNYFSLISLIRLLSHTLKINRLKTNHWVKHLLAHLGNSHIVLTEMMGLFQLSDETVPWLFHTSNCFIGNKKLAKMFYNRFTWNSLCFIGHS